MRRMIWLAAVAIFGCIIHACEVKTAPVIYPIDNLRYHRLDISTVDKATEIDSLMQMMHQNRMFNGSVLVSYQGRIIYKNAFGYSDFRSKDTLTTQSCFNLASISKPFTAVAVMLLRERGLISYDDSVQKYLPDVPYRGVTIRMMLNNTSGIPDYLNNMWDFYKKWDKDEVLTNEKLIQYLKKEKPLRRFEPGTKFEYSNTNYVLLASVVEKVSGQDFGDFLRENIFIPLEMNHTVAWNKVKNPEIPERVIGFQRRGKNYIIDDDDFRNGTWGDKNIYSSVEDLFIFDKALRTCAVLKPETIEEAYTGGETIDCERVPYGFGWRLEDPLAKTVIYHNGSWRGFRNTFRRYPQEGAAVIALTNEGESHVYKLPKLIREILFREKPDASSLIFKAAGDGKEENIYECMDSICQRKADSYMIDPWKFRRSWEENFSRNLNEDDLDMFYKLLQLKGFTMRLDPLDKDELEERHVPTGYYTSVSFVNQTNEKLRIKAYYADMEEIDLGGIPPGGAALEPTYSGMQFVVTDRHGRDLAWYLAEPQSKSAYITSEMLHKKRK